MIISGTKSSRGVHTMSGDRVSGDQLVEAEDAVDEVAPRAARDEVRRDERGHDDESAAGR